ncbi:hypothetical protein AB870_06915 [Pandoraea faecigallinarum]|uniref:Uncharacterized protein n=1 Tax=Pandoraea faecigallinarum TaxID=656179 RepID=A0A0H3WP62_9BURK|nr:hypothetical protein [Pandoraea faecigallinarum]AKM29899.1 hypothetical protein AB870_06915 [Pandoraea faecigallinarum]
MPSHSPDPSPMPFPFLPVVLESPKSAKSSKSSPSAKASDVPKPLPGREAASQGVTQVAAAAESPGRSGAARARSRAHRSGGVGEAAQPPGMDSAGGNPLRIEIVRSVSSERLTVLGAIVR